MQLFRRKPRGVVLTDVGRVFFDDAKSILASTEQAKAKVLRTARGIQGEIALGFTPSASLNPFVPKMIRAFQQSNPGVSLNLDEGDTGERINSLKAQTLDLAFVRSKLPKRDGLVRETVSEEAIIVAVPEGHEWTSKRFLSISLVDFRTEHLILSRRDQVGFGGMYNAIYEAIVGASRNAGFDAPLVRETPQIITAVNLVASGVGVTLVPESMTNFKIPGLHYIDLAPGSSLRASIYLAFRPSDLSTAARNFLQLVRKHSKS